MDAPGFDRALRAWADALGPNHVIRDLPSLEAASRSTLREAGRVLAILRPGSRDAVQAAVRIADRHGVPLYPISTGKNWGYGSRAPVTDGVLLDLGRLNRIVDYNEELAYVTVEPGVTQRQLYAYLRERGSKLWMDATGASPDCSIIGNTLERGFGHTPLGDHCGNACAFEVVLPTGECLDTGFGRFAGAKTSPVSRYGVGPSLDGLFAQSNMGIVTRMTVWLMPAPEHFQAFFFMAEDPASLAGIVDAIRPLRLDGTLRSTVHIGNDYKVLAAAGRFPWDDVDVPVPIDPATMARLRRSGGFGGWNGSGALYGTKAQVRDARRRLRRVLKGRVDRLQFVDDRLLGLMTRFARPFRWLTGWDVRQTIRVIEPVYNLMKGVPTDATLASAYWRKKPDMANGSDLDGDGCGLLWCSPVVPNTGADLRVVAELATATLLEHGFEPQVSVSLASERSAIAIITISYDRSDVGADVRALGCYRALTADLLARGYPPYRVNVASMDLVDDSGSHAEAIRAIKFAVDPRGILAPGRYEPAETVGQSGRRDRGVA